MTDGKLCVCPQCGKKYKLKEGFAAESFACKACSATVWVAGKPKVAPSKRTTGGRRAKGRGGRPARGRAAAKPRGRTRGRREPVAEEPEQEGRGRGRYQRKQDKTGLVIAGIGGVVVVAIVLYFALAKKEKPSGTETAKIPTTADSMPDKLMPGEDPAARSQPVIPPEGGSPPDEAGTPTGGEEPPADGHETKAEPARKLGGGTVTKDGIKTSRYDPPTDIPHVEGTSPEMRKQIDDLVDVMFDPFAGRDSLDAKNKLIALGKPAFPRVLSKMAQVRDTITDVDSPEERMLESSLKLADEALREMDGYLSAHNKSVLRPGSEKKYIAYICRLHYKRWVNNLESMPEMPGPFDASKVYESDEQPEDYGG